MIQFQIYLIISTLLFVNRCHKVLGVQDLNPPLFSESDTMFHGIFMPWDGIWEGTFEIYTDPNDQQIWDRSDLTMADTINIKKYQRTGVVQVRQKYESITPYFQTVEITDTYVVAQDTLKTSAKGVNKIQDGQIWCVVDKPEDKVIHYGRLVAPRTLVWSRSEKNPLRKEYFLESIDGNTYQIVGYGYYGDDDPDLSPKTWFLGKYHHISDYLR